MKHKIVSYRRFTIEKSVGELAELFAQGAKRFTITRNNLTNYDAEAKVSVGVFISAGLFHLPIKTKIKLNAIEEGTTAVCLKTDFRIEVIILTLLWIILVILKLLGNNIPLAVPILFPLIILWFWWIYKTQEEALHSQIEDLIKSY